jgi:hypothetical protein
MLGSSPECRSQELFIADSQETIIKQQPFLSN